MRSITSAECRTRRRRASVYRCNPRPWATPRDATHAGAAPPQRIEGLDLVPGMVPEATSEDCLTAEVWTPATSGRRAVLIWIPGGSFRVGSAGLATYDGRHLSADGDVVVVGLNYRLGLLGFLCAPGVPTNLGLRDLLAGIAWVRANIAQFGGDPDRITVMGESAGAGAIMHLLTDASFTCAGAIVLSGSPTMTLAAATATRVGERVLELAGATDVSTLAGMTVDELLDLQSAAVTDLAASVGMMPFHPWVDGDVVPTTPVEAIAHDVLAAVPLVVSTTCDEMELFHAVVPQLPRDYSLRMLEVKGRALGIDGDGAARGFTRAVMISSRQSPISICSCLLLRWPNITYAVDCRCGACRSPGRRPSTVHATRSTCRSTSARSM